MSSPLLERIHNSFTSLIDKREGYINNNEVGAFYAKVIGEKAILRSTDKFQNSEPIHAAIVMANIFKELRYSLNGGDLWIYANNLNGEISKLNNYRHELLSLLQSENINVKVLIDQEPDELSFLDEEDNAFDIFYSFANAPNSKVELKIVNDKTKVQNLVNEELGFFDVHFAVSSENMYRLELDSKLHFAECCFNDPHTSKKLINIFEKIYNSEGNLTKLLL